MESLTFFAPAARDSKENIEISLNDILNDPIVNVVMESVAGYILIINEQRQILSANQSLIDALHLKTPEYFMGLRPGEALGCEHAKMGPNGCGTSTWCQFCGAVLAILEAQKEDKPVDSECSMSIYQNGSYMCSEFHIKVTPLHLPGRIIYAFVFYDISSEKRREILEFKFFHDIRNILTGLVGWSDILVNENENEVAHKILSLSSRLSQDIDEQMILLNAERGVLEANFTTIKINDIFSNLIEIIKFYESFSDKTLIIDRDYENGTITTDENLLIRVLMHTVKNAFEASKPKDTITISFNSLDTYGDISIHNVGQIDKNTALRIFDRSFSTKNQNGRGIGTYTMRLLTERYLNGEILFSSSESQGTIFTIRLPK
jgi:hypothetical protein